MFTEQILQVSRTINHHRTPYSVLTKMYEEAGELSLEVAILGGDSYKSPGKDGVVGEAADFIIAAVDYAYMLNCSESDLATYIDSEGREGIDTRLGYAYNMLTMHSQIGKLSGILLESRELVDRLAPNNRHAQNSVRRIAKAIANARFVAIHQLNARPENVNIVDAHIAFSNVIQTKLNKWRNVAGK